jgi:hypothetical protein
MRRVVRIAFTRAFQWGVFATPACLQLLSDRGVRIVQNWLQADVIVSAHAPPLLKLAASCHGRNFSSMQTTRGNDRSVGAIYPGSRFVPPIHVMNVFSGDVFSDNHAFCNMHGIGDAPHPVHVRRDHFQARRKALAAMLSFSCSMLADPCPPGSCAPRNWVAGAGCNLSATLRSCTEHPRSTRTDSRSNTHRAVCH